MPPPRKDTELHILVVHIGVFYADAHCNVWVHIAHGPLQCAWACACVQAAGGAPRQRAAVTRTSVEKMGGENNRKTVGLGNFNTLTYP